MGGPGSELWIEFKIILLQGLMAARKHMDRIINIVEIMRSSKLLYYNFEQSRNIIVKANFQY
jgi:phosphatidylinositol 4-kinase B